MLSARIVLNQTVRRVIVGAVAILLGVAVPASAEPRASRLSKDLQEAYGAGRGRFDVIVQAKREAIEDAVARYGVRIKKSLKT